MKWRKRISETPLIPPTDSGIRRPRRSGRNCFVHPRDDQPGDSCPFVRSAPGFNVIPRADWKRLVKAELNNSELVYHTMNQGSVGSCASESKDQAVMLVREMMGLPRVVFNPYGTYGRVNGGADRGSSLGANLRFARDEGCFPADIWPRSKGWRANPSEEAWEAADNYRLDEYYEVGNWSEFASSLLLGWPVYWGYSGHAIVAVDLLNEDQFIYLNSWGQWGKGTDYSEKNYGFGVANRSSILWGYGVYTFSGARIGRDDMPDGLRDARPLLATAC